MIQHNRLRIFLECLDNYKHDVPLSKYLKEFYKQNKQMGSRDRKNLSHMMYAYFRLGFICKDKSYEERLMMALLLTSHFNNTILPLFKPEWNDVQGLSLVERIEFLKKEYSDFNIDDAFQLSAEISPELNREEFIMSHFTQPDLFLRAVKEKHQKLESFLTEKGISYTKEGRCFRLANASKVDEPAEYLFEIQDKNSQLTLESINPLTNEYWWDCCCASGGKSLLLKEKNPDTYLMCSDIRDSILQNLDERFKKAGVTKYKRRLIDLKAEIQSFEPETFDGIILDAPCTGSGTWARTPERMVQVDKSNVEYFAALQLEIASNAIQFLKKGKQMLYITCSVFEKENEAVIKKLQERFPITVHEMKYLKGYNDKADTMFVTLINMNN